MSKSLGVTAHWLSHVRQKGIDYAPLRSAPSLRLALRVFNDFSP